jgi:pyruvate/2-oxoglutarate dehydrogenase complex dihydrolipoamide dehydrogenase (E3) component
VLAASRVEWSVDFPKVSTRVLWRAHNLDDSRPAAAMEATGTRLVRGEGKLTDPLTVAVGSEVLVARRVVVIATAAIPPIRGLGIAARRLRGLDARPDHTAVPRVSYTDPEVASVGLAEAAAPGQGIDVIVSTADPEEAARGYIHDFIAGRSNSSPTASAAR